MKLASTGPGGEGQGASQQCDPLWVGSDQLGANRELCEGFALMFHPAAGQAKRGRVGRELCKQLRYRGLTIGPGQRVDGRVRVCQIAQVGVTEQIDRMDLESRLFGRASCGSSRGSNDEHLWRLQKNGVLLPA